MKIRVIDFECSGLKPPEAAICQVGKTDVCLDHHGRPSVGIPFGMFVNPGHQIPPEVRAIHHIHERDIRDAPPPEVGLQMLMESDGMPDIFCAHQAEYDRQFFPGGNVPWICTRKTAMRIWPEAPNHKNQTLRYWLGVDGEYGFDQSHAMPPHRAPPDTYVTAWVLAKALEVATPEQMIEWTNQPSLLPGAIHFGKHRGTPWSQVDSGYLEWLLRQPDMDSDTAFTARHWLNRRRADAR